jgi:putative endonuclease
VRVEHEHIENMQSLPCQYEMQMMGRLSWTKRELKRQSPLPLFPANAGTQAFFGMTFYVYLLASRRNGTLYLGYTDDLVRRMQEHVEEAFEAGFTARYGVKRLVWFERYPTREEAWLRERRMKRWRRIWKLELIERFNPTWTDLSNEIDTWREKAWAPAFAGESGGVGDLLEGTGWAAPGSQTDP